MICATKPITITITDDMIADEGTEMFKVRLLDTSDITLNRNRTMATVTITDNDVAPLTARFNPLTYAVNEGDGTVDLAFELSAAAPAGGITVQFETAGGSGSSAPGASAGDYTVLTTPASVVTIPATQNTGTITVGIDEDTAAEGDETFRVRMVAPGTGTSATTADLMLDPAGREATVTITDNDPSPDDSTVEATTPVIADGTEASNVTVTLLDADGDPLGTGGATVTVTAAGPSGTATVSDVNDAGDGTYTATVTHDTAETVTVRASLDGGTTFLTQTATVVFAPVLTFAGTQDALSFTAGTAITAVTLPGASGGAGGDISYAVSPALPAGLTLDTSGAAPVLRGTPTAAQIATTHTVTATETGGTAQTATLAFDITVDAAPAVTAGIAGPDAVDEGGTATYTVTLSGSPSAAVAVACVERHASCSRGPFYVQSAGAAMQTQHFADIP